MTRTTALAIGVIFGFLLAHANTPMAVAADSDPDCQACPVCPTVLAPQPCVLMLPPDPVVLDAVQHALDAINAAENPPKP